MRQGVRRNPQEAEAHGHLGIVLRGMGRRNKHRGEDAAAEFEETRQALTEAARLRPNFPSYHEEPGPLYTMMELHLEAAVEFEKAKPQEQRGADTES
jgi:hypothetical protein